MTNEQKEKIELFLMRQFPLFVSEHLEVTEDDSFYTEICEKSNELYESSGKSDLAKRLIFAFFDWVDEEYRQKFHKDKFGRDLIEQNSNP